MTPIIALAGVVWYFTLITLAAAWPKWKSEPECPAFFGTVLSLLASTVLVILAVLYKLRENT